MSQIVGNVHKRKRAFQSIQLQQTIERKLGGITTGYPRRISSQTPGSTAHSERRRVHLHMSDGKSTKPAVSSPSSSATVFQDYTSNWALFMIRICTRGSRAVGDPPCRTVAPVDPLWFVCVCGDDRMVRVAVSVGAIRARGTHAIK